MKEKKVKPKYVKICPNCNSLDIQVRKDSNVDYAFGMPVIYHCNNCGLESYVFPEIDLNEFKNIKNKENDSTKTQI